MIEASFAMQYGIRLRSEKDITWAEFYRLLSGIMPETPLGRVVGVRAEKDREKLRNFSKHEKNIQTEWKRFCSGAASKKRNTEDWEQSVSKLQNMLAAVFGNTNCYSDLQNNVF